MNLKSHIGDPSPTTIWSKYANIHARAKRWGGYSIIGVSVRGRLHSRDGTPRDDAFAVYSDGVHLIAAVSDGVGSRKYSRYGAAYSVNRLCIQVINEMGKSNKADLEKALYAGFQLTREDLEHFASSNGITSDELPCTLLGMIVDINTGGLTVGQIGDGLILALTNDGTAQSLIDAVIPDDLGATYVLTQHDWAEHLQLTSCEEEQANNFRTLYLMTDGVADDCQYGPPDDILQKWAQDIDRELRLIPNINITVRRLKEYLETYEAKGSFDDRTLVVLLRK